MTDHSTLAHFDEVEEIEDFPHDDVIDSRELHGKNYGPEINAQVEEASGYAPDWEYGETLIRDSYFEDYAQELADDIGAVPTDAPWPLTCIDWEQAARELQVDYTSVTIDGVDYWVR